VPYRRPSAVLVLSLVATLAGFALLTGTIEPFDYLAWGGSMDPHLSEGDIYVPVAPGFPWFGNDDRSQHGIVTKRVGEETGYRSFGDHGDVIAFPAKNDDVWVHRAVEYVRRGEVWEGTGGRYLARSEGYITKGDNNSLYDQEPEMGLDPVPPDKVRSKVLEPIGDPNVRPVLNTSVCRELGCRKYRPPSYYLRRLGGG